MTIRYSASLFLLLMLLGCSKRDRDRLDEKSLLPERAELLLPQQNSLCVEGTDVSELVSTITFKWKAALNTDTYELQVKNLLTKEIATQQTMNTEIALPLRSSTPYSWWVISHSAKGTDTVQTGAWKFFVAGVAATSFAPFPAELLSPADGQKVDAVEGKVTLIWRSDDVDKDLKNYDLYLGTDQNNLHLLKTALPHQADGTISLPEVLVTSGIIYYWKVISHDENENSTESEIASFQVN